MPRLLVPVLLAAACAAAPAPDHSDAGDAGSTPDGSVADAGEVDAGSDGGTASLSDDPTLDELAAYWDSKACRVYACMHRLRETDAVCERARTTDEFPFDVFRRAQASVAAGRATYRAAAGRTCGSLLRYLDTTFDCFGENAPTYRNQYAEQFVALCSNLVEGKVGDGGACDADSECVTGAGCVFDRTGDCAGRCVVWLRANEACAERWEDCAPGTYCDGTKCVQKTLNPDGATCYDQGESCQSGRCFDYKCRTVSAYNGECIEEGDCDVGLYCKPLPPSTGRLGICQQPVLSGGKCGYTTQCSGNQPCAGYFLKYLGGWTEGTCTKRPADVGQACVPIAEGYDYGDTGCYADLTCDPEASKCAEPPAVGAPCAMPGNRCGYEAWCDAGTCRAKKGVGEAATSQVECLKQFDRYEGKCIDLEALQRCGMR